MRALFISDSHLRKDDRKRMDLLLDFLHRETPGAERLFILGDMFEFFCGFPHFTYPWFKPVLDALGAVAQAGTTVYYLEGNHEVNLNRMGDGAGFLCADSLVADLDGRRTFISHGDQFTSPGLRRIIKSGFVRAVLDRLGPSFAWKGGMAVHVLLSGKEKGVDTRVREVFRTYARKQFLDGYDAVVLAHSHIPDAMEETWGGRRCSYLNTGDFFDAASYGEYTSEAGFRLRTYGPGTG